MSWKSERPRFWAARSSDPRQLHEEARSLIDALIPEDHDRYGGDIPAGWRPGAWLLVSRSGRSAFLGANHRGSADPARGAHHVSRRADGGRAGEAGRPDRPLS